MKNISETAYLVAMYRALETERPDALFQDPFARLLAGGRGKMLVEVIGKKQQITTAIAIRTRVIDEIIGRLIESEGIDTVINLAAGLDTRPYRLSLPSSLHWIEVDLPEIISYKEQTLKSVQPVCSLESVKLDITDITLRKALFSKINMAAKQVLVITEGLLSYLYETQVASLAVDLNKQPNLRWWLFELESSLALQHYHQIYERKIFDQYFNSGKRTLLFAPEKGAKFFQQYGWKVGECRSTWKELFRLKQKVKFVWLLKFMRIWSSREDWEKMSQQGSIVLLESRQK